MDNQANFDSNVSLREVLQTPNRLRESALRLNDIIMFDITIRCTGILTRWMAVRDNWSGQAAITLSELVRM
jgi:hypothetical protein